MAAPHQVIIIAKQRPFDEEKWKQLLTAFAYVLHERRKAQSDQSETQPPHHPEDKRC